MTGAPPTPDTPTPQTQPLTASQITRISSDLNKMTQNKTPVDSALYSNILRDLRAGVAATEDVLRSTKIGINVNRVKDPKICTDKKVQDQAGALVKKWKQDIQLQNAKKAAAAKGSPAPGAVKKEGGGAETPVSKSEGKWRQVKPESRTVNTDGVDWKQTGDAVRDNCIRLLYDGLAFMSQDPPTHILSIATAIEDAAYTVVGKSNSSPDYKAKIRSLFQNLKAKPNAHLRTALLSTPPTLTPSHFVTMPPDAMKSQERLEEDAKMAKENKKDAMVPQEDRAISSMLTCGGCGQKKVSYSQAQTRSADEPMTTFCTCTVCGRKWKFS